MPQRITEYLKVEVTETKATLIVATENMYPNDKKNDATKRIKYSFRLKLKNL
jgi:hypothetical protein